jgi:hypothetical protein
MRAPAAPTIQIKVAYKIETVSTDDTRPPIYGTETSDRRRFVGNSMTSPCSNVHEHYIVSGSTPTNVCFGSRAEVTLIHRDVGSYSESGHSWASLARSLSAKKQHRHTAHVSERSPALFFWMLHGFIMFNSSVDNFDFGSATDRQIGYREVPATSCHLRGCPVLPRGLSLCRQRTPSIRLVGYRPITNIYEPLREPCGVNRRVGERLPVCPLGEKAWTRLRPWQGTMAFAY